jgi:hypothetical protein
VFRTAFGEPVYPDTPSQLLPKLIEAYNKRPAHTTRSARRYLMGLRRQEPGFLYRTNEAVGHRRGQAA